MMILDSLSLTRASALAVLFATNAMSFHSMMEVAAWVPPVASHSGTRTAVTTRRIPSPKHLFLSRDTNEGGLNNKNNNPVKQYQAGATLASEFFQEVARRERLWTTGLAEGDEEGDYDLLLEQDKTEVDTSPLYDNGVYGHVAGASMAFEFNKHVRKQGLTLDSTDLVQLKEQHEPNDKTKAPQSRFSNLEAVLLLLLAGPLFSGLMSILFLP